jgi:membrane protease subunit HflK
MPWNSGDPGNDSGGGGGGKSPWGNPGGGGDGRRPNGRPGGPQGPWGGGPRGPGGGGTPPDIDELIARAQAFIRGLLPSGGGGGRGTGGFNAGRGLAILAALAVAVWLFSGFYRVQPDEQGVVLRFGAYNRTTLPGLNYHLPWPVESVLRPAVTRINRIEIGYRSAPEVIRPSARTDGVSDVVPESLMLTGDENIIDIDFAVFWRIRDASAFLFNTRNPAYTVKSAAESVMREVIGKTPIQPALTDARAQIEVAVKNGVQAIMDAYGSGVEITQIQLQKVDPPSAVIDSFRDVQRANTDAERLRNEAESYRNDIVPRARGDAAAIVAEADAARQAGVAAATGQTQRFLSVLEAYNAAKDVTMRRLYLETMQEILTKTPAVILDDRVQNVLPFLPLGEAGRNAPPVTAGSGPATGAPANGTPIPSIQRGAPR